MPFRLGRISEITATSACEGWAGGWCFMSELARFCTDVRLIEITALVAIFGVCMAVVVALLVARREAPPAEATKWQWGSPEE
jgi:hypothetical protein